jgi:hypothetical protein
MAYNVAVSEPPPAWSREGIDAVLEFLDDFEDPNFVAAVWYPPIKSIIDGQEVTHMPYPTYSDRFEEFWKTFHSTGGFIHPYNALPEDETDQGIEFSVMGAHFSKEYLETATVDQIRRCLSLFRRGERFCDGYTESQFLNGSVTAALLRLKALRNDVA